MAMISITSCEKEDLSIEEPDINSVARISKKSGPALDVKLSFQDKKLDKLARRLASSLEDEELRAFIKTEALKKFDGDYDILYSMIKGKNVGSRKFSEHLNRAGNADEAVSQVADEIPLLNIAVPVNIEKWDTETFTPMVAFAYSSFDENTTTHLKAYDSDGNIHWLDAKQRPDHPIIILGLNERVKVDQKGNLLQIGNYPLANLRIEEPILAPEDPYYGGGGNDGGSSGGSTNNNCRVDKKREYLKGINCTDLSSYESWHLGAPELRLRTFVVKYDQKDFIVENFSGPFKPNKRDEVNNKWWGITSDLFYWDKATMSLNIMYHWTEEDISTDVKEVSITFSPEFEGSGTTASVTTKFDIGGQDKDIGKRTVHFEDCDEIHSIGTALKFKTGQL